MLLYNKYIFTKIFFLTLGVLLVVTGMLWFVNIGSYIELVTEYNLELKYFVYLTIISLPMIISLILPIAFFIAIILVYNKLITDSEINILLTSGLNKLQLAKPAIFCAFIIVFLNYCLTFFITPISSSKFFVAYDNIKNNSSVMVVPQKKYNILPNDMLVYIDQKLDGNKLAGILVHDFKNPTDESFITASFAEVKKEQNKIFVNLFDGSRMQEDAEKKGEVTIYFDSYKTDFDINNEDKNDKIRNKKPEELYIHELSSLKNDTPKIKKYRSEMHRRILFPMLSLTLLGLTLIILFFGEYSRRSRYKKNLLISFVTLSSVASIFFLINLMAQNPNYIKFVYSGFAIITIIPFLLMLNFRKTKNDS